MATGLSSAPLLDFAFSVKHAVVDHEEQGMMSNNHSPLAVMGTLPQC